LVASRTHPLLKRRHVRQRWRYQLWDRHASQKREHALLPTS
jgi:hypothetical protein